MVKLRDILTVLSIGTAGIGCWSDGVLVYDDCILSLEEIANGSLIYLEENRCVSDIDEDGDIIPCKDENREPVIYSGTEVQQAISCLTREFENEFDRNGLVYPKRKDALISFNCSGTHASTDAIDGEPITMPTIYGPIQVSNDNYYKGFYQVLFHELGHAKKQGGGEELQSTGHEFYTALKTYLFSQELGSFTIDLNFYNNPAFSYEPIYESDAYSAMYLRGRLLAVALAIEWDGNLEESFNEISSLDVNILGSRLENIIRKYGDNTEDQYYNMVNKLISLEGFRSELEFHLGELKTEEFLNYLEIRNLEMYRLGELPDDNPKKIVLRELLEKYEAREDFTNRHFRGRVVELLSPQVYNELKPLIGKEGNNDLKYELAKWLVEMHEDYPCREMVGNSETFNPFTCPEWARDPRKGQLYAYYEMMRAAELTEDEELRNERMQETSMKVIGYIHKFYPSTNFYTGNFDALNLEIESVTSGWKKNDLNWDGLTNNLLAYLAFLSGQFQLSQGNTELAKSFYQAVVSVECQEKYLQIGNKATYEVCTKYNKWAQDALENLF